MYLWPFIGAMHAEYTSWYVFRWPFIGMHGEYTSWCQDGHWPLVKTINNMCSYFLCFYFFLLSFIDVSQCMESTSLEIAIVIISISTHICMFFYLYLWLLIGASQCHTWRLESTPFDVKMTVCYQLYFSSLILSVAFYWRILQPCNESTLWLWDDHSSSGI